MRDTYLPSAVGRHGGFPGGGRGRKWAASSSAEEAEWMGRGILLLRDRGLEEEEREGASSP